MPQTLCLLPTPRQIEFIGQTIPAPNGCVRLLPPNPQSLMPAGEVVQQALRESAGHVRPITAGGTKSNIAVEIGLDPKLPGEGYRLQTVPQGVSIVAGGPAGAFYGAQTFAQIVRQSPGALPAVRVEDWPDFASRGVMLDISRNKVPTMATLFALVDLLAEMKINQLQLYTEHTFAYRQHPDAWSMASPMTAQEILELDAYCAKRFIELVPNQNSFGHLERWLKLPRYHDLAECPDGFTFPWGARNESGFSLNPLDPRSLELVEGLFDELLPNFTSKQLNVGCDETFDIGLGRSKAECEKRGKGRVYLDFVLKIYEAAKRRGRKMQFWGDIILHHPELIRELPRDAVALEWGYEANHPFAKDCAAFRDAGIPFYVCPGTSTWCSIAGRTDNCLANLKAAAEHGLASGAVGYLNTDWGDYGHLQYLPMSYMGLAAGAAYSWCLGSNGNLSLPRALDLHVFRDSAGVMGQLAYELGNVYQASPIFNGSRMFWSLAAGEDRKKLYEPATTEEFDKGERLTSEIIARLPGARMQREDAALVAGEFVNAAGMLGHGCRRGRWRMGTEKLPPAALTEDLRRIIGEHERLWVARNRIGGLHDSAQYLRNALAAYPALPPSDASSE